MVRLSHTLARHDSRPFAHATAITCGKNHPKFPYSYFVSKGYIEAASLLEIKRKAGFKSKTKDVFPSISIANRYKTTGGRTMGETVNLNKVYRTNRTLTEQG